MTRSFGRVAETLALLGASDLERCIHRECYCTLAERILIEVNIRNLILPITTTEITAYEIAKFSRYRSVHTD